MTLTVESKYMAEEIVHSVQLCSLSSEGSTLTHLTVRSTSNTGSCKVPRALFNGQYLVTS